MAAIRFSCLRSLCSPVKFGNPIDARPSFTYITRNYPSKEAGYSVNSIDNSFERVDFDSAVHNGYKRENVSEFGSRLLNSGNRLNMGNHASEFGSRLLHSGTHVGFPSGGIGPFMIYRSYSSVVSGGNSSPIGPEVPAASSNGGLGGSDWIDKVKDVWRSTYDAVAHVGEKGKEAASSEVIPYVQQLLDTHPYLRDVVVPVGGTLTATVLAWMVLPRLLRRLHKYATQAPATLLSGTSLWGPVEYEKSVWAALGNPVRYLITFVAFMRIGAMVAPTTVAAQYLEPAWRGAVVISFVWFLHRWKTNVISRSLTSMVGADRDKLLTIDKVSSIGLFVLGALAFAEACGVPIQSILTVGGVGGVAAAFAARDVLGNILSGLSVHISQPFSVGDTIKAGSVEGQVVEMGLTTTSLLTSEKFPVTVPNSLFSSQAIVNKSRAQFQAMVTKIPLLTDDLDKIPKISNDIKAMLRSNPNAFLENEAPYCFLSRVERSFAELTLGCSLKSMSKEKFFTAQQDILLESVQIIKQHGATLSSFEEDTYKF